MDGGFLFDVKLNSRTLEYLQTKYTMKRITFCLAIILGIVVTSEAQIHVELGPSFQSPSGDFGEVYDFGVGFSIEPRITFDKLGVGLYGGALGFAGGNVAGTNVAAMTMTPYHNPGVSRYELHIGCVKANSTNHARRVLSGSRNSRPPVEGTSEWKRRDELGRTI